MGRYMAELEAVKLALQLKGEEAEAAQQHAQGLAPNTQQLTTSALPQLDWDNLGAPSQQQAPPQGSTPANPPPPPDQQSWPQSLDPWDLAAASAPSAPSQAQAALALPTFESSAWLPVSEAARERHMLLASGPSSHRSRAPRAGSAPVYPQPVPRPEAVQQASLMDADHRPHGGVSNLMPPPQLELQLGPQQLEVRFCALGCAIQLLGLSGPEDIWLAGTTCAV